VKTAQNLVRLLFSCAIFVAGCGYHFGASGTNLPAQSRTIYVERFLNQTRLSGINDEFDRYMKDEIANHHRLEVVDSPNNADLVLSGTVVGGNTIPYAFNSVLEPTLYGSNLSINARLLDRRSNRVIWQGGVGDSERMPVVAQAVVSTTPQFLQQNLRSGDIANMTDIQVAQSQTSAAQNQSMANLAQQVYDSMASGF